MTGNFLCCKQPLYQLCHKNCPTPLGQLPHLILDAHWPVPASRVDPHDLEKLVAKTSPIAEHCLKTISRLATSRFFHGHFWPLPSWFYSFLQRTVNKFTFELEPRRRVLQFSEVTAQASCPKWLQRHNIKSHLFRAQLSFSFWRKIFLSTRAKLQMEADVFQTCLLRRFRSVCNETSCKVINVFNSFVELKDDGILATKPKSIH